MRDKVEAKQDTPRSFRSLVGLLRANWRVGELTIVAPSGERFEFRGPSPGGRGTLEVNDFGFLRRVLTRGDTGFAEGYMAGEWTTPDLSALLETFLRNYDALARLFKGNPLAAAAGWLLHKFRRNSRQGSQKNIHAHYDLGNAFYEKWLDSSMTYSSARFETPGEALEPAQRRKYQKLAEIMDLRQGHTVLEIGCGWGGFAEFAAREVGALVTGITISREQFDYASNRIGREGLSDRAKIEFVDYRDVQGRFDRVASIEMFEAVGQEYWPAYFGKIGEVLKPGGRAGLQIITIEDAYFDDYRARSDFIQQYIFPGGMLGSEAALKPVIQSAGLAWDEVQRFGRDYGETLARWAVSFQTAWADIARLGFDERFRRLWAFYLSYCEAGFRVGRTDVIQMGLSKV